MVWAESSRQWLSNWEIHCALCRAKWITFRHFWRIWVGFNLTRSDTLWVHAINYPYYLQGRKAIWWKPRGPACLIAVDLFSLPSGNVVYIVQPVLIPTSPFPDRFILSDIASWTSPISRNYFIRPLLGIHWVILVTSSGLFIIASNDMPLACLWKSPLPFAHCGHANTMCLSFCNECPHWQLGFSTPGTFLLHR